MTKLIQNHPLFQTFPVKGYDVVWQNHKENGTKIMQLLNPFGAFLLIILVIATLSGVGISFLLLLVTQNQSGEMGPDFELPLLCYLVWGATILGVAMMVVAVYWFCKIPVHEQQRYYQQGGLNWLDERKRQALRLDIVQTYSQGFWIETLEYYPIASRLKEPLKKFPLLDPSLPKNHLQGLYDDWNIADGQRYQELVQELWDGMHSRRFAFSMKSEGNNTWVKNIAALIEEPIDYIISCIKPGIDNHPPLLLWGFDLWRVITLSRISFCAGLISEQQAWNNILETADRAHEIFGSFEEFNKNYRLGHAFWSNDYKMVKGRLSQFNDYKDNCHWPIKSLPWPPRPGIILSDSIISGFANEMSDDEGLSSIPFEDYVV